MQAGGGRVAGGQQQLPPLTSLSRAKPLPNGAAKAGQVVDLLPTLPRLGCPFREVAWCGPAKVGDGSCCWPPRRPCAACLPAQCPPVSPPHRRLRACLQWRGA